MKNFDAWNEIKKDVENKVRVEFKEGELWWCDIGLNIGSEQDGPGPLFERPIVIAKKFSTETFLVFPLSSNNRVGRYYFRLSERSNIILCQPRLIDAKRLKRRIGALSRKKHKNLMSNFRSLL
jgi:mRNA interferase MazF